MFFRDLYASSWIQRVFKKTRRLSKKMSKLRAIKHDISKHALSDRICMGYMDLENKRIRVLIQGPFLQIYEAGQDFRSRFPLYVVVVVVVRLMTDQLQKTTTIQVQFRGRRRKETRRTIFVERNGRETQLCGSVSSSSRVSIEYSNGTALEWCRSCDTYKGYSRSIFQEMCTIKSSNRNSNGARSRATHSSAFTL